MWRSQIEALSDEFTVIAWDAPGYGGSSDPPEDFPLSDFADCLAAFIEALGFERTHVLGVSFGGGLALELYNRHPELTETLVLASAYAGWAGSLPSEVVEERLTQALRLADMAPDQLVAELIPTMLTDSAPAELVEEFEAGGDPGRGTRMQHRRPHALQRRGPRVPHVTLICRLSS
jgi:pimeloyl-ACP methyl ester carboxylesterase